MKGNNSKLQLLEEADQSIVWGLVKSVNPEAQTMSVFIENVNKEVPNISINNQVSVIGTGIRFMPVPKETKVLLLPVRGKYHHIGYINVDSSSVTEDKKGTKKSSILLQRYLEPGEVQLISRAQGEILLSNDGSVLIKSGFNSFVKLTSKTLSLDILANNTRMDFSRVRVRSGVMKRPDSTDTTRDILVLDGEGEDKTTLQEFTVEVGTVLNANGLVRTDKDETTNVTLYPNIGLFSIADKVYNENAELEELNTKYLQGLLRFHTGLSFNIDEEGTFTLLDETNQNHIKFTVGVSNGAPLTTYELKINDTYISVGAENDYTIKNAHSEISSTSDGTILVTGDAAITIQSGSTSVEPSVLGDSLNSFLTTLINWLAAHTHGTGVGPSTAPVTASVLTGDILNMIPDHLSPQVKNN